MKKLLGMLLVITMAFSTFTFVFASDEIIISTPNDLMAVASGLGNDGGAGKVYKLTTDINLEGALWNDYIIGSPASPFKGTFDGNGHIISNYKLNVPAGDFKEANGNELDLGLFGAIGGNAVVKNLGVAVWQ